MASSATLDALISRRFPSVARLLAQAKAGAPFSVAREVVALWVQMQLKAPRVDTLYIVSGVGEHLLAILPRLDPTACLVIYEASVERLKATLASGADYMPLLADERVHLFVGECTPKDFERLHHLPVVRVGEVIPLRFSPAWSLDERGYDSFFSEFARQYEVTRRLHLTNIHDSLFWQATTLENLPYHAHAPDVRALHNLFPEPPIILVGAGPSLDEAEAFLRAAAPHSLVVAVNSSYRKLRKIGIRPHLVLAADPREDTARGFDGQPTDGTYLVSPFIVSPRVAQAFHRRAFCWSGENNFLIHTLRRRLGLPAGTQLLEMGTVSISVASLAELVGCRRLILVGQDMATTAEGITHTADSIYADHNSLKQRLTLKGPANSRGNARLVPGNTLPEVPTLENLYVYLKLFEQWVEHHPQIEVINTARLGARILGTKYLPYDQALEVIARTPAVNIQERLASAFAQAPESAIPIERWRQALEPTMAYARKLYTQALAGAIALESLPEKYLQPAYREHREVKEITATSAAINQLIDRNPENYRILIEGGLKRRLLEYQQQTRVLDAPSAYARDLLLTREFFWALVEGIEPTLGLIQKQLGAAQVPQA
jgi:hypothetical protein